MWLLLVCVVLFVLGIMALSSAVDWYQRVAANEHTAADVHDFVRCMVVGAVGVLLCSGAVMLMIHNR